ncbi:FtsH protease activity modulator HflK [Trinickia terrae]|uniref:Protein HflK n=1 Tax=Trinickia terrae TaxID=2571161 RepID=A0A4V5PL08_9BURK|nr:FtsH protease activity modulator HflK [Trinickia terrae]TKC90240.1 FtsH protease activity modulator HflK [Trinickia terrae]
MNEYKERSTWLRLRAMLSINDPRWGRSEGNGDKQRPNEPKRGQGDGDGPPDLDEMWRDFNRRLSGLFGGKGKGRGVGPGGRPDNGRAARVGVGIVIGVLVAIYLGSGIFIVQDGQAGVVLQFGKYRGTVGQGVHWRLPYPFETQEIVNIAQVRAVEIGRNNAVAGANVKDSSMLTRDGDILDVRFAVQYQVKTPTDYLFHTTDPDQSVTQAAQAAVREIVGARSTEEMLYQDREAMRQQLQDAIQHTLDQYRTGLAVTGVTIESMTPPAQVQSAFDDAAKARTDRERAKHDAQAYASALVPRAQGDAARMIDDAKSYADRVVAEAQGDAERFEQVYAQYSKAPAVIRQRMYLETMQQIYSNATKVYVGGKTGANVILPLDKIVEEGRQRASEAANGASGAQAPSASAGPSTAASGAAAPSSAVSAPNPASQAAAASDALRSRDAFRSRGREDELSQ